jgi:hypothetical protein
VQSDPSRMGLRLLDSGWRREVDVGGRGDGRVVLVHGGCGTVD